MRPYFVLGDVFVNAGAGAVAAVSAQAVIAPSWHPIVAMPLGMCVGSFAASVLALLFMPLFGAFEVMLPVMLTGMVAGMAAPMVGQPALLGIFIGVAVVGFVYLLTALAGRSSHGPSRRA
jgi:hypothetical protein